VKRLLLFLPLLLAGALLLTSCGDDGEDFEAEIAVPVSVEEVKLRSIEEFIIATGTVNSTKEMDLVSEMRGLYELQTNPSTGRPFVLGDRVTAGTTIVRLENPEELNNARLDSRRLHLETAELEFEKQQSLFDKGGVTRRELADAERTFIDARYDYENAVLRLAKLAAVAPFDGYITDLPYHTPDTPVAAGQRLAQVMDYAGLHLDVSLPGKDLDRVSPGQDVRIMNYTLPDDTLSAQVAQVAPALDPQSRSFKVSIEVANPELLLRPGMFVKAEIVVARRDSAVVVPKDILLAKRQGRTVFVVDKGAADERVVSTGLENPDEIEITAGLMENERLVVKGFETLRDHAKVKVIR